MSKTSHLLKSNSLHVQLMVKLEFSTSPLTINSKLNWNCQSIAQNFLSLTTKQWLLERLTVSFIIGTWKQTNWSPELHNILKLLNSPSALITWSNLETKAVKSFFTIFFKTSKNVVRFNLMVTVILNHKFPWWVIEIQLFLLTLMMN